VKLRPGQKLLVAARLNSTVRQIEHADRLAEKCRLPSLDLHHRQGRKRSRQLERDGWRSAAGADIHDPSLLRGKVAGRQKRLEQQTINRLVRIVQRSEVDLAVPVSQKLVVGDEAIG
jgi:hypothetical protein